MRHMRRITLAALVVLVPLALVPAVASASGATVGTQFTNAGPVLVHGNGKALYMFTRDRRGRSACGGACAQAWLPLLTTGTPTAGNGVSEGKLGTVKRADGTTQVTYGGHPLYRSVTDHAPGDINGHGRSEFGGRWSLLTARGSRVVVVPPTMHAGSPF
jgi:predicted lipoprotein with Yx(FWY)xxD motif